MIAATLLICKLKFGLAPILRTERKMRGNIFLGRDVAFRFALCRGLAILLCHSFRSAMGFMRGVRGYLAASIV